MTSDKYRKAVTHEKDIGKAIQQMASQLDPTKAKLNILFISNEYELDGSAELISKVFGDNVIACTTAGEISEEGYSQGAISGLSIHGDSFLTSTLCLEDLSDIDEDQSAEIREKFEIIRSEHAKALPGGRSLGILLVDGLSIKEDLVAGIFSASLGDVLVIGGSAADEMQFVASKVLVNGRFSGNSATLTILTTTEPFEVFKVQHYKPTESRVVITKADPEARVVYEIDGEPAAEVYARLLGVPISQLSPINCSKSPLMLRLGEDYFIRSVQKVNEDLSLKFYCAIDNGLVLTLGEQEDMLENLRNQFNDLDVELGEISVCLLFECILRRIEFLDLDEETQGKYLAIFRKHNATGFHTYGEQYGGIHINQTLTGVAFGRN